MDNRKIFLTLPFLQRVYHEGLSDDSSDSSAYNGIINLLQSQCVRFVNVQTEWLDGLLSSTSDDFDDLLVWDFLDDGDPMRSARLELFNMSIDDNLLRHSFLAGCFLVDKTEDLEKIQSYGIPAFSFETIPALLKSHEKRQEPIEIKKDEPFEWKRKLSQLFSETLPPPINSVVIIDPYLPSGWYNNLPKILEYLIPKKLTVPIQITLVYSKDSDDIKNSLFVESFEQGKQIGQKYFKSVHEGLRRQMEQLGFSLELIRCENENEKVFHDRIILTNSYRIKSGAGFSLLYTGVMEKLAQNLTELTVDYMYFRSALYETPLKEILKIEDKTTNRLFRLLDDSLN